MGNILNIISENPASLLSAATLLSAIGYLIYEAR